MRSIRSRLGWSIDAEQQRTFLDFSYFVKPDSKLAKQLTAYEDTSTNFAGFYQPDVGRDCDVRHEGRSDAVRGAMIGSIRRHADQHASASQQGDRRQ